MDEEEIHDGEDCLSSADQPLDLSQSSEMMSLPSGFKLADISITSDITDSEIENEDTVLGSNICKGFKKDMLCNTQVDTLAATGSVSVHFSTPTVPSGSVGLLRNSDEGKLKFESSSNEQSHADELSTGTAIITSCHINSTVSVASNGEVPAVTSLSLDDVKFALQENCDLLSDRHLLNELLKSIDEKLGEDSAADCTSHIDSLRYSKSLVPPNRDPGPSLGWKSSDSTNIGIGSQNVASGGSNVHSTSDPLFPQKHQISSKTITPFSSVSCIAPSQRCISNDIFSLGTHNSVISQEEAGIQNGHSNLKEIQQELNNGVFASNLLKRLGATDLQEESVSDKNTERHVKFQQPPEKELTPRSLARNGKHALCQQHDVNIVEDITSTTQAQQILM
ncbi:uncharacterized protein LOC121868436 [Homarus americanus]|uniref:uncharacterized protein LOC121868436 n=1 Tax=Homarus americanus TaxID=6706 RepID=UPI001C45A9A1|nr:uncharacterized protein LOC121868436 [Homarus americanus]